MQLPNLKEEIHIINSNYFFVSDAENGSMGDHLDRTRHSVINDAQSFNV